MISVGNSTMTISTLILLLATGILTVTAVDDCLRQYTSITNCCDLQTKFYFARTRPSSGVYLLKTEIIVPMLMLIVILAMEEEDG